MKRLNKEALRHKLSVYFILGTPNCRQEPVTVLREAINGGITIFQFREKGRNALKGQEKYAIAEEMQYYCRKSGVPFIINDDIELALELDADGVHIGQEDGSVEEIRERIGNKILGVSVHDSREASVALAGGADYFGAGPVFPTKTKEDARPVQGLNIITNLRNGGFNLPVVGIGGITAMNASSVIKAGADGIAVISAISLADDVWQAAALLKNRVDKALKKMEAE